MEIIPAILPTSRVDLEEKLARLAPVPGVSFVQIDAVDGVFASPASWPYRTSEELPKEFPHIANFHYDADLMVADAAREGERFGRSGAARLTIHIESAIDLSRVFKAIGRTLGRDKEFAPDLVSIGLALSLETPLSLLEPHIGEIDYVQLMGIAHIGRQHEPFDGRVLPKIEALHKKYPHLPIQIDGGVSLTSAPSLVAAGASRLVVGSALFGAEDIGAQFAKFEAQVR